MQVPYRGRELCYQLNGAVIAWLQHNTITRSNSSYLFTQFALHDHLYVPSLLGVLRPKLWPTIPTATLASQQPHRMCKSLCELIQLY